MQLLQTISCVSITDSLQMSCTNLAVGQQDATTGVSRAAQIASKAVDTSGEDVVQLARQP